MCIRDSCFKYEDVEGARANDLPDHVPDEVKEDRWRRFMETAQTISAEKMQAHVGRRMQVLVDEVDDQGAVARSWLDAPEIDGNVFIDDGFTDLAPGDMIEVEIDEAAEYDLWGRRV